MNQPIPRYAVLRSDRTWQNITTARLATTPTGVLTLARVPGLPKGQTVNLPAPFEVPASGLAIGPCHEHYFTHADQHQLIWLDDICHTRKVLPIVATPGTSLGEFNQPRGLLLGPLNSLYVADSANGRVQIFQLPGLELRAIWHEPLQHPTGLATDSQNRVYVLDQGLEKVVRFSSWGSPDTTYNAAMAGHSELVSPVFFAIDESDRLYVSDADTNQIWQVSSAGESLFSVPLPNDSFQPRALVADSDRLYIADADSGNIWILDLKTNQYLGTAVGYRGPVSAMAIDETGNLYIKSGQEEHVYSLQANSAYVTSGSLVAGPLDAGDRSEWERLWIDAEQSPETTVKLQIQSVETLDSSRNQIDDNNWQESFSWDLRVNSRYLWLRVLLSTEDPYVTPQLLQVQAETQGENYLDYLPALYRQADAKQSGANSDGFLRNFLALLRTELTDLEWNIESMPKRLNPTLTPPDYLPWLASWLAFDLPKDQTTQAQRNLLLGVHDLYKRRTTLTGVREFVELYTGVRPVILEAFRERRLWVLDQTSTLGFDTALPATLPEGMVVPDSSEALVVGQTIVGQSTPLDYDSWGETLFSETAHLFTVLVPAARVPESAQREALKRAIDNEKPAHTDYHLCFVEPRMRIGIQSHIGVDTIIAGPPEPASEEGMRLGLDSFLGDRSPPEGAGRIGQRAHIGYNTMLQ